MKNVGKYACFFTKTGGLCNVRADWFKGWNVVNLGQ